MRLSHGAELRWRPSDVYGGALVVMAVLSLDYLKERSNEGMWENPVRTKGTGENVLDGLKRYLMHCQVPSLHTVLSTEEALNYPTPSRWGGNLM